MQLYLTAWEISTCRVLADMYAFDQKKTRVIQDSCSPCLLLGCLHRCDRRCAADHWAGRLARGRPGHRLRRCWGLAGSRLGSHCWRLAGARSGHSSWCLAGGRGMHTQCLAGGRGTHSRCLAGGKVEHDGAGQEHAPKVCSCCKAAAGREHLALGATEWTSTQASMMWQLRSMF